MAQPRRLAVLLHHERLPVAVLEVLAEYLAERRARPVAAVDARLLPDPAAALDDAQVVLVVLVAHQRLVEAAEALEGRTRPGAEVDGVGGSVVIEPAREGAASHPARLEGRRRCGLHRPA